LPFFKNHTVLVLDISALKKFLFQVMIAPLAPTLAHWGAGAHCDTSVNLEISLRLRTGDMA